MLEKIMEYENTVAVARNWNDAVVAYCIKLYC